MKSVTGSDRVDKVDQPTQLNTATSSQSRLVS